MHFPHGGILSGGRDLLLVEENVEHFARVRYAESYENPERANPGYKKIIIGMHYKL